MKLLFGLVLISAAAGAQPDRSNDEPSPAVRVQQRQAEQPTPSRPGEAAIPTGR